MSIEAVGFQFWNELSEVEQNKLIEQELWVSENLETWKQQRQSEMRVKAKKMARKHAKKGLPNPFEDRDFDDDDMD